ncbi:hypothetical protein YC2023_108020 [Brassica napus]
MAVTRRNSVPLSTFVSRQKMTVKSTSVPNFHVDAGSVKGPFLVSLTAGSSSVRLPRPKMALYEIFPLLTIFNQLSSKRFSSVHTRDGLVSNQPSRTDSTLGMLSAPEPVTDNPRISRHTLGSPPLDSVSTPHGHHPIQVSVQS